MIRQFFVLAAAAVLHCTWCFPELRTLKLPDLEMLEPGDVNNLSNEQQKRSIETHTATLNDIEATIREVQDMIKANPSLPRLTRGEIIDILENITKSDMEKSGFLTNSKTTPEKTQLDQKHRDPKAIMVVMPYTPSNPNDDKTIADLYTKPPITHIIGAEPFTVKPNSVTDRYKNRRRPQTTHKNTFESNYVADNYHSATRVEFNKLPTEATTPKIHTTDYKITTSRPTRTSIQILESFTTQEPKTTKRFKYTTQSSTEKTTESFPEITTKRYNRRRPPLTTDKPDTSSTTYRPRTRRPVRRRPTTPSTTTSTTTRATIIESTAKYANHKYPSGSQKIAFESLDDDDKFQSGGIKVIQAPQLALPEDINSGFYDLAMQENRRIEIPDKDETSTTAQSTTPARRKPSAQPSTLSEEINLPEHLHGVVDDMKLDPSLMDIPENYHKTYQVTTHSPSMEERKKIQALIQSMSATSEEPEATTQVPDVSNIADTLSPEMRDLLMSFGLIPNPNEQAEIATEKVMPFVPDKAEVDPASFTGFKPLPEEGESRDEMETLLAAFGLGRSARKQKSLARNGDEDKKNELNFDVIPEAYKHVIKDIGFDEKSRKLNFKSSYKNTFENGPASKEPYAKNAFRNREGSGDQRKNEEEEHYATPEELRKLQKLMSAIQQLEQLNRTVTDDDLNQVDVKTLNELIGSLNNPVVPLDEQLAPNPINYASGLKKNEVKRQEPTVSGNLTVVTPSTAPAAKDTKPPNLEALEESFGGQSTTTVTTTTTTEPTTTTPRTGFYYLVDWNSFLDIDDQKGKRVNLRFQPTIGNPKNFLSVNVP